MSKFKKNNEKRAGRKSVSDLNSKQDFNSKLESIDIEMADSMLKYYGSLVKQKPTSALAISWCIQNGHEAHAKKYGNSKIFKSIWDQWVEKKKKNEMKEKKSKEKEKEKKDVKKLSKTMKALKM